MSYLLDTNILSETRKRYADPGVREWISAARPEQLHISVLTVGEIGRGVARLRKRGDQRQATVFETWLHDVVESFGDRILSVHLGIARHWAAQPVSRPLATTDALIAATATAHSLALVTRNTKDFDRVGVQVINPFS